MEEKSVLILDALKSGTRVQFGKLLADFRDRSHGVMTFLAGLELARRRILFLRQASPFRELWIYRRNERLEAEEDEGPENMLLKPMTSQDEGGMKT